MGWAGGSSIRTVDHVQEGFDVEVVLVDEVGDDDLSALL